MRKLLFCLIPIFFSTASFAAITTTESIPLNIEANDQTQVLNKVIHFKIKDVENTLGRKLSFKEKLSFKLLQWKINKYNKKKDESRSKKGHTAMIFGILGLAFLLLPVPYLGLTVAVVSIVLALVLGYQAKKENPADRQARTAIILGWIGAGLLILATLLVIALLASWA